MKTTTRTTAARSISAATTTLFVRNAFLGQKAKITSAVKRSSSPYGAARIISKELGVPFQVAYGVSTLSDRSLRRLCNNS